jgi:C4-dicarboxylate-specific signal transduction histidine kinase
MRVMGQPAGGPDAAEQLEAIAQPLTALVARAEVAARLARDGEAAELAAQLAAMAASAERLAELVRAARQRLEGAAG